MASGVPLQLPPLAIRKDSSRFPISPVFSKHTKSEPTIDSSRPAEKQSVQIDQIAPFGLQFPCDRSAYRDVFEPISPVLRINDYPAFEKDIML